MKKNIYSKSRPCDVQRATENLVPEPTWGQDVGGVSGMSPDAGAGTNRAAAGEGCGSRFCCRGLGQARGGRVLIIIYGAI
jgi:hypothetical protein